MLRVSKVIFSILERDFNIIYVRSFAFSNGICHLCIWKLPIFLAYAHIAKF